MLTHVYHHDESTPNVTSVTFPMSSTQNTTDLDLRYYGTNLRWVSMLFTHQQCSRYECGQAKKFLDPNSGELYKELQISCNWNRTWSSLESSNRTWTPEDGLHACVWVQCMNPPEVVSHKLYFKQSSSFSFSASSRIQPQVQLVGSSSWVLWKRELHLCWSGVPFWSGLRPTCLARSSLPLQWLLATLGALAFLS